MLRPLRAHIEFNSQSGEIVRAELEGEIYSPLGSFLLTRRFAWTFRSGVQATAVAQAARAGFVDLLQAEGLRFHLTPPITPTIVSLGAPGLRATARPVSHP